MPVLVCATTNRGKLAEIEAILRELLDITDVKLVNPPELGFKNWQIEETGTTFAENAVLKARNIALQTNLPCLADDSGLCVDALDGEPGIHSARWTGENDTDQDRTAKLLIRLKGKSPEERSAQFICAMAIVGPNGNVAVGEGACKGLILQVSQGSGGFGYDPIFYIPEFKCTLAEMSAEQKNKISHRRAALAALKEDFPLYL
jgi:non-canonical purine NTP pyrophosphatase (RdgB/HAM1 family)